MEGEFLIKIHGEVQKLELSTFCIVERCWSCDFSTKKKEERITVLLTHIENEEPWESVELQPFFNSAVLRSKVKNFNFIKFERINSE